MATMQTTTQHDLEQANHLYWSSDRTVDEIMGDLGIGKRALYGSIRPIAAGASCSICGGAMVFPNRSSRDAGRASCESCGNEAHADAGGSVEVPLEHDHDHWSGSSRHHHFNEMEQLPGMWSRWREDLSGVEPQRAALVAGGAALGVMVGAVAARAVREML